MIYNGRPPERERGVMVDDSDGSQKVARGGPEASEPSVTHSAGATVSTGVHGGEPAPARDSVPASCWPIAIR